MCGIAGLVRSDRPVSGGRDPDAARDVAEMLATIRHRGPDDIGIFQDGSATFGAVRLAIMDVERGHQPFETPDRSVAVVQNGEIYNHVELRRGLEMKGYPFASTCDTEVLLNLYLDQGPTFVDQLNGMFAISVWDGRIGQLHLYRDRLGEKPLFFSEGRCELQFASEIKALLRHKPHRAPDMARIHELLTYNFVPGGRTMFEGIKSLAPGEHLTFSSDGTRIRRWWRPEEFFPEANTTGSDAVEEFAALLSSSVKLRLRSDVPVGAFLSGGLDSSTVFMEASRQAGTLEAYTAGFSVDEYDETRWAAEVASLAGGNLHKIVLDRSLLVRWPEAVYLCDQPHGDMSFLPMLALAEFAREGVKVVLTGDGADELFGGYTKYQEASSLPFPNDAERHRVLDGYMEATAVASREDKQLLYGKELVDQLGIDVSGDWAVQAAKWPVKSTVEAAIYNDIVYLLAGNNLVKPDRMCMASGLEARPPFLDHRIVELALQLPVETRMMGGVAKGLVKAAATRVLPERVVHRRKQMFTVPVGPWARSASPSRRQPPSGGNAFASTDLVVDSTGAIHKTAAGDLFAVVLQGQRFQSRGLVDSARLEQLLVVHRRGNDRYVRLLRLLVAIELWYRVFIDSHELGRPPASEIFDRSELGCLGDVR